jgi:hypothetical protein
MRSRRERRALVALPTLCGALALSGCWGVHDAAPPALRVDNRTGETVVVTFPVDGVEATGYEVDAHGRRNLEVPEDCTGESIVISTPSGEQVAVVEEPACPDRVLILRDDAAPEYRER